MTTRKLCQLIGAALVTFTIIVFVARLAFANTPGQLYVTLTWNAPTGTPAAATYNVYRGISTGSTYTPCPTPPATATPIVTGLTSTTYIDATVVAGTAYGYAVTGVSAGGEEGSCSTAVQVPVSPPPAPPTGLSGVAQ
jgi:hypothetical protein